MNALRVGLLAAALVSLTTHAQSRTGSIGGYYVTECKTIEYSPKVRRCTLSGCQDVYLPLQKKRGLH